MAQIWLNSCNDYLSALLMRTSVDSQKIVILLPGFMQAKSDSYYFMSDFAKYLNANGFHVLMVDLMGSGDSFGRIDDIELTIMRRDVLNIINYVRNEGYDTIHAVGRGLIANILAKITYEDQNLGKIACINPVYIDTGMREKILKSLKGRSKEDLVEINDEFLQELGSLFVMTGTEECNITGEYMKASFLSELIEDIMNPYDIEDRKNIQWFHTSDMNNVYNEYFSRVQNSCNEQFTFTKYNDRIHLMKKIISGFMNNEGNVYESTF